MSSTETRLTEAEDNVMAESSGPESRALPPDSGPEARVLPNSDYYDYDYGGQINSYGGQNNYNRIAYQPRTARYSSFSNRQGGLGAIGSSQYVSYASKGGKGSSGGYGGYSGGYGGYSSGYGSSGSGYGGVDRSGYGYGSYASSYKDECPGIPLALLLVTLLGIALMGYILYLKVVAGGGKRRKRDIGYANLWQLLEDIDTTILLGLEEFEEKIDRIADGEAEAEGENSWISQIYKQFAGQFQEVDNELTESDMDGIEPPLLDETWNLGLRNASFGNKNSTSNSERRKRAALEDLEADDEDMDEENSLPTSEEDECRVGMWRCLSKVIEGGLHYIDEPEGLMGFAKKTMFKVAFHGGLSNAWGGLMAIPEARNLKKCMTVHDDCMSYAVLRKEAANSLDPADPDFQYYVNLQKNAMDKEVSLEKEAAPEKKENNKRKRLLVNPDLVENQDTSDGTEEFDLEVTEELEE